MNTDPLENQSPPPPESDPIGDINVEYTQPELLYQIAKDRVDNKEKYGVNISNTLFGDDLFSNETTRLVAFAANDDKPEFQNVLGCFTLSSTIHLSSEKQESPNNGYYSQEKVHNLCNNLIERGLDATTSFNRGSTQTENSIFIRKNGFLFELKFGVASKEIDEKVIQSQIQEEKTRNHESTFLEEFWGGRLKAGLTNPSITLHLVTERQIPNGRGYYPKLESRDYFENSLRTYTSIYEETLNSLYSIEELPSPDLTITLRPPILNQDTLAKLASTEARTPTPLLESQIRKDQVTFKDIAGQDGAVEEAKRLVMSINYPEIYSRRGVRRPKGILLYGPPGTGKTLIAKAVATEAKAEFMEVSSADINNKWYGESERMMQKVFNDAKDLVKEGKKVVLFFDEIDSLALSRDRAQNETTQKVLAILLQNMDGMKADPNITIIAATNRPDALDPAFKRPGRIDKLIHVGLPDTNGRSKILQVHMERAKGNAQDPNELFSSDIDLKELSDITNGMSGADLANLINLALEDKISAELRGVPWAPITTEDMIFTATRLGLLKKEKEKIGFGFIKDA